MTFATELADGFHRSQEGGPRFLFPLLLIMIIGGFVLLARRRRRAWFEANGGAAGVHGPGQGGPVPPAPSSSAMTLLQERFARGEIGEAEFRHRRSVLQGDPAPPAPTDVPPTPPVDPTSGTTPTAESPSADQPGESAEVTDPDAEDDQTT